MGRTGPFPTLSMLALHRRSILHRGIQLDRHIATIGSRGYGSNYGLSVPFTSSVFTNTTGQPAEFVLRLKVGVVPTPTLAEFTLTVTWSEGPNLTLFLDREPNDPTWRFRAEAPESDHATYLPGADRIGASVPLGEGAEGAAQALELVAAYVDETGAVVPPPSYAPSSVTFALKGTSAFRGFAMNAGSSTEPEFSLLTPVGAFGADHTARAALLCHDYGGFTTATVSDGQSTTPDLRLPKSSSSNWLPDLGWPLIANDTPYGVVTGIANLNRDEDSDDDPADVPLSDGAVVGDGLVTFDEYRGFLVRGEHRRTNPYRKDLFLVSDFQDEGLGDALNLPASIFKHRVLEWELSSESETRRQVNTNYYNHAAGQEQYGRLPQQGLIVHRTVDPGSLDVLGIVYCTALPPCSPNLLNEYDIQVFVDEIALQSPIDHMDPTKVETLDDPGTQSVIGHEVGHAIGIGHPTGPIFSIMNQAWEAWGLEWQTLQHQYLNRDTQQIRINKR